MNYRERIMALDLGWSTAELRSMAAEMAAEADQEIAQLRAILARIESKSATMTVGDKWPKGL